VLIAASFLGLACKTYKDEGEKLPAGYEAGVYPPAPGRQVFDDGGLIMGGGGAPGGGGMVIAGHDSGMAPPGGGGSGGGADAASPVDASAGSGDGGGSCPLLAQSCGPNMGCYPAAAGQGRCQRTDPGSGEGVQCFEPANCAPGLTCVGNLCSVLCSTAQAQCNDGRRCVALGAYEGVGYCLP
jgi:hypothetical protein